jgi:hypothetical protein
MHLSIAAAFAALATVNGHGAVVSPMPRNAVDRDLAPWNGPVPCSVDKSCPSVETQTGWCPSPNAEGKITGSNGQSCFWFSNGCAVGCDTCDGSSRGPIPRCGYEPSSPCPAQKNPTGTGQNKVGPGVACHGPQKSTAKPTICDSKHRTININATCGGEDDWYFYSPWRAPGAAPVMDSCGVAGGHQPPQGSFGGIYVNTTHAHIGDYGTKVLPKTPTGTSWKAGETVEVSWTIEANHAGGYLYRLAPADGPLTEEEFQKMPLEFVGQQGLRWGGGPSNGGSEHFYNGTYVDVGTVPAGSKWSLNPIPRYDHGAAQEKPCVETATARCSGMQDGSNAQPNFEIVDRIAIPAGLTPGDYVLGWRWDCEESNQIWQSCSDVTITV